MSVVGLRHDVERLAFDIDRVLRRASETGVRASAAGSPLGDALDALAQCRDALIGSTQTESRDHHPALARIPVRQEGTAPAA